jgi:hypothetical protein
MRKPNLLAAIIAVLALAGCSTTNTNFSASMNGVSDYTTVVVKDFTPLGIITVRAVETHYSSPFGFVKSIDGAKITYGDLMQAAARLEADDIINVRIDINSNYKKSTFDWITGWTRTYTYIGTALAIKYTERMNTQYSDPQLGGLPKAPESTSAVRKLRNGKATLK